jgi:hypothetical protein
MFFQAKDRPDMGMIQRGESPRLAPKKAPTDPYPAQTRQARTSRTRMVKKLDLAENTRYRSWFRKAVLGQKCV